MGRKSRRGIRTKEMINIAKERIDILFSLAREEASKNNFTYANRYVELARKIGMRYNVRLPTKYRMHYCKKCNAYLLPSKTSRVRLKRRRIVVYCNTCHSYYRHPY